jgi:hypothetical protein
MAAEGDGATADVDRVGMERKKPALVEQGSDRRSEQEQANVAFRRARRRFDDDLPSLANEISPNLDDRKQGPFSDRRITRRTLARRDRAEGDLDVRRHGLDGGGKAREIDLGPQVEAEQSVGRGIPHRSLHRRISGRLPRRSVRR